jgi:hypothetical protein
MPDAVGRLVIDADFGWRCMADPEGSEFNVNILPSE